MDIPKTKIAIISHSLGGGGAERFAGLLGFMLSDIGYEIHNIILTEIQDYDYAGSLLNLGKLGKAKPKWKRKFYKGFLLHQYLKVNNITTIIDNRPRNFQLSEWLTRQIYSNRKVYYLIQNYNLKNYLPENVPLAKLLYGKATKIVCVSQAIEEQVQKKYHFKNTIIIENPVSLSVSKNVLSAELPEKFILFFGRFDDKAKNFSLMLEAFWQSEIFNEGYLLILMGDGPDINFIKAEIEIRQLQPFVKILPYQHSPFAVVQKARFTVLTSHFEGFPLSIVESLANGTPVLAVDCNSGPREVIQNEQNGLIVENYNPDALATAMQRLVNDEMLYENCKKNAAASVVRFSTESIAKKWDKLLSETV